MNINMSKLQTYIKDRNDAMMAYPDTSKLDDLVKKYPDYFSPQFKRMFSNANTATKVRTLQIMIREWLSAPDWLIDKINEDDEKSESGLIDE